MCFPGQDMFTAQLFHLDQQAIGSCKKFLVTYQIKGDGVDLIFKYLLHREPVLCILGLRKGVGHIKSIVRSSFMADACKKAPTLSCITPVLNLYPEMISLISDPVQFYINSIIVMHKIKFVFGRIADILQFIVKHYSSNFKTIL